MFGFKDPTRVINVIDDTSSLIEAKAVEHERVLASTDLLAEARKRVADVLRPEVSGISVAELERGAADVRAKVTDLASEAVNQMRQRGLAGRGPVIPDPLAHTLVQQVLDWQFGAGALETLFREPDVEDIVINSSRATNDDDTGALEMWTYRQSGKRRESISLTLEELREIINRNAGYQGRALNPITPILNAQMKNGLGRGARINAILSPACDPHISVTIRVHRLVARTFNDLVKLGTLSVSAASWLWLCVQAGLSMVVGGATSSGKTNFLNALAGVMPAHLRCVVIEDTRELELSVADKVYLTTVQNAEGLRAITQRQLVANALRMRPDRIILGEVRDAAAWDAVKACNTGHDGTLLSLHAEDAPGALIRLTQLCGEAPETANIPAQMLHEIIASAFQCVVFMERRRLSDGSYRRTVTQINEVNGYVSDGLTVQKPLFLFEGGELSWSNQWPHDRLKRHIFEAGFSDRDIEAALTGRARLWEVPC